MALINIVPEGLRSPVRAHLDIILNLLSNVRSLVHVSESHLVFLIIIRNPLPAELVIVDSIILSQIIDAALIVVSSLISSWGVVFHGLALNALASTAEDLNEKEQSDPCHYKNKMMEGKELNIENDIVDHDHHHWCLLPVDFLIIHIDYVSIFLQSLSEKEEHQIVADPLDNRVRLEALIIADLPTFDYSAALAAEKVDWCPADHEAPARVGESDSNIGQQVVVQKVEVEHERNKHDINCVDLGCTHSLDTFSFERVQILNIRVSFSIFVTNA